jgi:hypothetical protein
MQQAPEVVAEVLDDLQERMRRAGWPPHMVLSEASEFTDWLRGLYPELHIEHEQGKLECFAGKLYETYCTEVGGKAFNGDSLPDWQTFRADPAKRKQSDAWVVVAQTAVLFLR